MFCLTRYFLSPPHRDRPLTSLQRELKASSNLRRVSGTKHFFMVGK